MFTFLLCPNPLCKYYVNSIIRFVYCLIYFRLLEVPDYIQSLTYRISVKSFFSCISNMYLLPFLEYFSYCSYNLLLIKH